MKTHLYSLTLTLLLILPASVSAQLKQVCFTYDDLPVVSYGINDSLSQQRLMTKLVSTLVRNRIPAIGFVNEIKLYENTQIIPFQERLLTLWADNGLDLGNHTFSHPDYNNMSFESFVKDIIRGEIVTGRILKARGKKLKYFRHPYLHTGNPKEKADSLDLFLTQYGYITAPVTIDNDDYLFALAYKRALANNDTVLSARIGSEYVSYMENKLHYFENQSHALFQRPIPQILLLHSSQLNADYTQALADVFSRNGYEFVTLDAALKDEAFKTPVTVFGNWGISWIDRWALSAGKTKNFFINDPQTPEFIRQLAK